MAEKVTESLMKEAEPAVTIQGKKPDAGWNRLFKSNISKIVNFDILFGITDALEQAEVVQSEVVH